MSRRHVSNGSQYINEISGCSAVECSVNDDRQLELDSLSGTQPVKTGKGVGDVSRAAKISD